MEKVLYKPFVSKSKNKKYSVYVMKEGRHGQTTDKNSAKYWSHKILW